MTLTRPAFLVALNVLVLPILPAHGADPQTRPPQSPLAPFGLTVPAGVYVGTRQGLSLSEATTFSSGGATRFESSYDAGRETGLLVGYTFGPVLGGISPRVELEGLFGNTTVSKHKVMQNGVDVSPGKADSFGELRTYTGLVNGYLDFNLGGLVARSDLPVLAKISPFIGAGVGFSEVSLRRQGISGTGVLMDASDTRMTFQVSAGLSYAAFEATSVDVGFRHMRTPGLEFKARDGTTSSMDLVTNTLTVAIRRSF